MDDKHEEDLRKQNLLKSVKNLKIAHKLIFYGLESCITCAMIYPLCNLAQKHNLISKVETNILNQKESYTKKVTEIMQAYGSEYDSNIPIPVILIQLTLKDGIKLVSPAVVTEIAMTLSDGLDSFEKMEYIDGETPISILLLNQLHKLVSNLIDKIE